MNLRGEDLAWLLVLVSFGLCVLFSVLEIATRDWPERKVLNPREWQCPACKADIVDFNYTFVLGRRVHTGYCQADMVAGRA